MTQASKEMVNMTQQLHQAIVGVVNVYGATIDCTVPSWEVQS